MPMTTRSQARQSKLKVSAAKDSSCHRDVHTPDPGSPLPSPQWGTLNFDPTIAALRDPPPFSPLEPTPPSSPDPRQRTPETTDGPPVSPQQPRTPKYKRPRTKITPPKEPATPKPNEKSPPRQPSFRLPWHPILGYLGMRSERRGSNTAILPRYPQAPPPVPLTDQGIWAREKREKEKERKAEDLPDEE